MPRQVDPLLLAVGSRDTGGKSSSCHFCRSWPMHWKGDGALGEGMQQWVVWAGNLLLIRSSFISQREQDLKCSNPYARPSAQSLPPFDRDGTGCAELQLDKYQPILSLSLERQLPSAPSKPEDK